MTEFDLSSGGYSLLQAESGADRQAGDEDRRWMRAALEWSWRGKGWTSPRPSVGCVLVREGRVLGGGHTQPGDGQPHAEAMALREAWRNDPVRGARGATAYVTLEPCSHWGTTPPCCTSLIREGVARVVAGVLDPDPRVAGRGFDLLRLAEVEVEVGVLGDECFAAMDDFLVRVVQRRPFVTLKAALSLDGFIALPDGSSQWITGPASREYGHRLRHFHDAIAVGIETVLADDPRLDVRLPGQWRQPRRVVLDSRARTPLEARLWDAGEKPLIAVAEDAPSCQVRALRERGAHVVAISVETPGRLDWLALLRELERQGLHSLLIEGGARVAGSALAAGIVNKAAFFVAPMLLGQGKGVLSGFAASSLSQAPRLSRFQTRRLGEDVLLEGYLGAGTGSSDSGETTKSA